jgi:hypothetical protein
LINCRLRSTSTILLLPTTLLAHLTPSHSFDGKERHFSAFPFSSIADRQIWQQQKKRAASAALLINTDVDQAENDDPQPQVEVAFGLRITNCDPSKPSE